MTLSKAQRRRLERALIELRWRRYRDDPEAFFRDCVWVPAGKKLGRGARRVRLEMFDYQTEALEAFQANDKVVILKARQLGLTTITMAYVLHHLLFTPGANVVLVSKNQATANKALELLDFMWQFLPDWVLFRAPKLESDSATHHQWRHTDGMTSTITSYAATKTVGAGQTATLVVWDEAALAEHQADVLRTLEPTTDAGGKMLVFSTARGGHNAFAVLYKDAERGQNAYVTLFFPWFLSRLLNPKAHLVRSCEYGPCERCVDRSEYETKRSAMASEPWRFYAEYPESPDEAFRQSGRSRFAGLPPLERFRPFPWRGRLEYDPRTDTVVAVEDPDGPLRLRPEALDGVPVGCRAAVSVDPATGTGGDWTAMTGGWVDREGVPQRVAFWHANDVEPAEASAHAALLGRFLADATGKPALLAVEKQGGYGDTFIHELRTTHGYTNLYVHTYTGHRQRRAETTFGFPMTYARRPLVIDMLARHLNFRGDDHPVIEGVDPLLRTELGTFVVRDDGKVTADVGCHDDLVMSTAIWLYVAHEVPPSAMQDDRGESDAGRVKVSVAHIFAEAEEVRRVEDKAAMRQARRRHRAMRRHR